MSYDFQSKASGYSYGLTYLKIRLTINQKHATFTHTHKRNPSIMQKKTIKPQKKNKRNKEVQNQLKNKV